ncbi:MAG TPA: SNF2-related protein [Blastocatellia bacterium]|nr:SNF2-related protein [Blastocatellia bacterium]
MTRKISTETRRRLKDAAKARWAKEYAEQTAASVAASRPVPSVVVALDIAQMELRAGASLAPRGRDHSVEKRCFKLESVSDQSVTVEVNGNTDYLVTFELADGRINGFCECPDDDDWEEVICEHKVAAAIFLREHYAAKPARAALSAAAGASASGRDGENGVSSKWREQLDHLLRKDTLPAQMLPEALLFFSMIRRNQQWVIQPGIVQAAAVPASLWRDRKALSAYLLEHRGDLEIGPSISALQSDQLNTYAWVNSAPGNRTLVMQVFQQLQWSYSSQGPPIWEGLANALVFRGHEQELITEPLEVISEIARVGLELRREAGGVRLSLVAVLPDRTIKLNTAGLEVFHLAPLWLCKERQLFQVGIDWQKLNFLSRQAETVIPEEAADEFHRFHLPELAAAYDLRADGPIEMLAGGEPQPRVYLTEQDRKLRVLLRFAYDGLECIAVKNAPPQSYVRDGEREFVVRIERQVEREKEWWQRLGTEEFNLKSGNIGGRTPPDVFLLRATAHPFDFLKDSVPKLAKAGVEVFGEADLELGRINRAHPAISFDITSSNDWFDLKAVIHFGELAVSLAALYKALRKQDRFIRLADGSVGEIPEEWLDKYKHLFGLSETTKDGLRLSRHHLTLLGQLLADNERVTTDKQFEDARAGLKNFEGIRSQGLPQGFQGELRPYQKAGFDWLHFLRESRFGGCLADDMGTGKTIQTLCFLESIKEDYEARNKGKRKKEVRAAHLLIVPRSLVTNWEREAQKFALGLKLLNFAGAERAADARTFDRYDVVLTTYGILLRELERLVTYEFDTVILDEAQAIKNPVSESAKAARSLKSRHRLTLTGTPVENNTLELWSQFAFLNPGLLGTVDYFREGFAGPIERQNDPQATKTLRRLVYPFILRRTKDQVALDLPPRSEKILWGEMEPEQRKLYNLMRDEYRAKILKLIEDKGVKDARFQILEGLLRLRQICNHPRLVHPSYKGASAKLGTLQETLETLRAEGHKALIFSQFVRMLKLIEMDLKKLKIQYSYLDGSTVDRQACVDTFQTDDEIRVFLISLKAGGVGLNLTAADYVIHVDPWWNPAVEMQATDRAHRIGQGKPVFVYKLLMRDSVEEKILQLQERKRSLVQQLVTTETGFFKSLTAEDITALFS